MANGHGGRRPGAGRPAGSPDKEPRLKLLTNEEKRLVMAYREQHAEVATSARLKAITALVDIVTHSKDDHARVKAAATLLGQSGGPVVQVGVGVQVTTEQDATRLVIARLDALALQGQAEAERAAAEQADPFGDVLGDVGPSTGWPALAELMPAAEPAEPAEPIEPVVVDALPDPIDRPARGAQSESDDAVGAGAGSPHPDPVRGGHAQPPTAAAAWTGNGFGPVGDGIGSSVDALGGPGPTSVETGVIPLGDRAPVDTGEAPAGLVTGTERSARTRRAASGYVITEVGKDTGTGLPSRTRRAGRTG